MTKIFRFTPLLLLLLTLQSGFAQERNQLFFVFLNNNPDKELLPAEDVNRLQKAHLRNIEKLHAEEKLLAAGPFEGGGGMFILQANRIDEAWKMLETDPAISANRFKIELFPLEIRIGDLASVGEIYNMTTLVFIRFQANLEFPGDWTAPAKDSRLYAADINNNNSGLLLHGVLSEYLDGIMIFKDITTDKAENIAKNYPAVKAGLTSYSISTLYIADGTFVNN